MHTIGHKNWGYFCATLGMHSTSQDTFSAAVILLLYSAHHCFVGTPNFMLVAGLVWPENNFKLCYLAWKTRLQQMSPVDLWWLYTNHWLFEGATLQNLIWKVVEATRKISSKLEMKWGCFLKLVHLTWNDQIVYLHVMLFHHDRCWNKNLFIFYLVKDSRRDVEIFVGFIIVIVIKITHTCSS